MDRRLIPRRRRGVAAYSWTVENALDTTPPWPPFAKPWPPFDMVLPSDTKNALRGYLLWARPGGNVNVLFIIQRTRDLNYKNDTHARPRTHISMV